MTSTDEQLASYFAMYEPAMAKFGKALRAKLRKRLPGLNEIVYRYENQDALVIAYAPSENGYEGVCSMGLYPGEVKLFFSKGASLKAADPNKLLRGTATVRHVVLGKAADFDRPDIQALMVAALKLAGVTPKAGKAGEVIVRAEAQKKRASRAAAGRGARKR